MSRVLGLTLVVLVSVSLAGCFNQKPKRQKAVSVAPAPTVLSEDRLVDVSIRVFEPGPIQREDEKTSLGISHQIRQSEARFIPVHLKSTLERTGYWGAVRVVPQSAQAGELTVSGKILLSDGEQLQVQVSAEDATGLRWLDKTYKAVARMNDHHRTQRGERDAFQDLYNAIANDLIQFKRSQGDRQLKRVRQIAELRFAQDLAPDVFAGYLATGPDGSYRLVRLPADDDPMVQRIRAVRERDRLLVDTVNGHYENYYRDVWEPYSNWRKFRTEELDNLREVENDATTRKVIGIGAVVGAIALDIFAGTNTHARTGSLRDAMVVGGVLVAKSGFDLDKETELHEASIEELGESFESDVHDMVVEVDGETHRLTGSAEEQYAKWRALLSRIYAKETGLPSAR